MMAPRTPLPRPDARTAPPGGGLSGAVRVDRPGTHSLGERASPETTTVWWEADVDDHPANLVVAVYGCSAG